MYDFLKPSSVKINYLQQPAFLPIFENAKMGSLCFLLDLVWVFTSFFACFVGVVWLFVRLFCFSLMSVLFEGFGLAVCLFVGL